MYVVVHTVFRICRLLAFTPNTMYVVVLYLQPMYVGVIFDQSRWRSKILRQDTKACVCPTHKNQEKTPEIHTAFRICRLSAFTPNTMYGVVHTAFSICRLLAFTPNTMYVVVLYLQPMYVGVIFDQRRWRSKNTATRYQGVRMAHS